MRTLYVIVPFLLADKRNVLLQKTTKLEFFKCEGNQIHPNILNKAKHAATQHQAL